METKYTLSGVEENGDLRMEVHTAEKKYLQWFRNINNIK